MAEIHHPTDNRTVSLPRSLAGWIGTLLVLALIVGGGAYLRFLNLADWDGGTGHHPDERFMHYTVFNLRVPTDWHAYFRTSCPDPVPAPRNATSPRDQWEPSVDSGCSTLNPRNFVSWSAGYVYGTLPTTIARLAAETTGRADIPGTLIVGRTLSAAADLVTLLALFWLAQMLYGKRVGLLAAAFYACAVMPIQQSHFFTVDNFAVAFGTLALVFITRLARRGHWYDAIFAGLTIAAAVASKINMAALVGMVFVALAQRALVAFRPWPRPEPSAPRPGIVRTLLGICGLLLATGAVSFVAFRIFQPDAFAGPNWWNIRLDARFVARLREAGVTASGAVDIPPGFQWASRTPWLFPLQNLVIWGLGAPLGVAAWLGWGAVGWRIVRSRAERRSAQLIPWAWAGLYFLWQGQQFVASMRYFLPIYPPLVMFAALGLIRLIDMRRALRWPLRKTGTAVSARMVRSGGLLVLLGVLAATGAWAWGYTRIYTRPYTRVAAADWLAANAPEAITTWELWDDPLPRALGQQVTTYPYAEDEPSKYLGGTVVNSYSYEAETGLLSDIGNADYVVLTSPRVYGSVTRVPQRYPATVRYYQALFDGSLGFELVGDFSSYPELLGRPIDDGAAEEAFSVYDHPRVLIFRRTDAFSLERARQLIVDATAFDEVYRGLLPAQINRAPTALQLSAAAWTRLGSVDTGWLFRNPLGMGAGLAVWVAFGEALAFAAWGMLRRLRLPLPDGGLAVAPMLGLLVFALPPALLGASGWVVLSRALLAVWAALVLASGAALLAADRRAAWQELRHNGWALAVSRLLLYAVLALALLLGAATPRLPALDVTRWTALIRTPTLPPYDVLFAGGLDPLPYSARLPFAAVERLLGLEPLVAFRLALPFALGLAVLGVWAAIYGAVPPRVRSQRRWALLAACGALLLLLPGLPAGGMGPASLWYALAGGSLDTLALVAVAATALGVGAALLRPARRWRLAPMWLVLGLPLAILRGHGLLPLGLVWLALVAAAWAGGRGSWRLVARACLPPLVLALVVGQPFAWSVAVPSLPATAVALRSAEFLLGIAAPLLVVALWSLSVAPRLAERLMLRFVAALVLSWTVLTTALGWPAPLMVVLPLMALAWLGVQAWLPPLSRGYPPQRWRTGLVHMTAALALFAFTPATLMLLGRIGGDGYGLFGLALVLLVVAAGWTLPLLERGLGQRLRRASARLLVPLGVVGLICAVLGVWLTGGAVAVAGSQSAATAADTSPELLAATRWLATSTPHGIVVTAPGRVPSGLTSRGGLPTLVSAVDGERWLRDAVQPAVNPVIDGRVKAAAAVYGGKADAAQTALATYQVGYVLVGPAERTTYGPSAGSALAALAQQGEITLPYDRDGIQIYAALPPSGPPPYVVPDVTLRLAPGSTLDEQAAAPAPVVDEYGWNTAATRSPALAIGLWLALIEALGLLAYPLTGRIFRRWHDRGWGWSKLVGLLVWGYLVWLPVSLGWWLFSWRALAAGGLGLLALSALALRRRSADAGTAAGLQLPPWRAILSAESVFLAAFALWTLVRAANPDLWHPYYGGEKPFEFGFLNAILRTPTLPPYDPFFSGGVVNYYYYGLYLAALPIKAIGVDPAIGFNLAIPLLLAFTVAGAWALGRELTGRRRYGLLAILLLVGIGTAASAVVVGESRGIDPVILALRGGLSGFGDRIGAWFWGPSRVVPFTINEFPLFGFLFADLHPHLIALPITLLAIACALELSRRRPSRMVFGLAALVIGTLAAANSWDAPTYALVTGGALVGGVWRAGRGTLTTGRLALRMAGAALLALAMAAAGGALFVPFFRHYQAMVGGIGLVRRGDTPLDYALIYGPLLYVALSLLGALAWSSLRAAAQRRVALRAAALGMLLMAAALLIGGAALPGGNVPTLSALRLLLALLGIAGVTLAFAVRLEGEQWLTLWLVTVGALVGLGMQLVFVRDHLAGGDYERMNTVFKFGIQVWALWAIGGAAAVPIVFRLLRRHETLTGVWLGLLLVLLLPGLLYPLVGIPSRLGTRFDRAIPLTLDGLAFMPHARYTLEEQTIDLAADAEAIAWLKANVPGTPVVATSEAEFYRAYGVRVAANTGLPTILGRLHEDEQRDPMSVYRREDDVHRLFNTTDQAAAAGLLAKYAVAYIYIGPVERALYDPAGLAKFTSMRGRLLDLAYENGGVAIYRVRPGALAQPATKPGAAPQVSEDSQVADLRTRLALAPDDGAVAYSLGQRLGQLNRPDEAIAVLEAATQKHPADVPARQLLGDLYMQLGRGAEAIAAWQAAADAAPTAANLNKLGVGLVWLGQWDAAETTLARALQLDGSYADAHFYLGELYRSRKAAGDPERAAAAYQAYLDAAPADGPWRALAQTHLAELAPAP